MEINLKTLNPEQKKAVIHDKGPLLIVAGAGTGKTTVITQRMGWLIEQEKTAPDQVLALTFTDKAAAEMEERVDKLLPYGYIDLWILTFHSFAEKILKNHALEIGVPNDFKLLNQTEQWLLVREHLDKFNLDYYRPLGNPTKFIHALLKLFSRAKDEAVTPEDYLKYAKDLKLNADSADFIKDILDEQTLKTLTKKERKELVAQEIKKTQEVADAYHTYQQLLLENNALDFGDLINYTLQLFAKRPAILAKYRQKFKYILVDEFQDTNFAQYELIKTLALPENNITVVGDDDQSIYKFRGASVSNILEFKKDYPKASEVFLTKNYRSTQEILDLSYQFIKQNDPDRLEVKLEQTNHKKLSKKLKAQTKEKGTIEHFHFQAAEDEARGVLEKINQLKEADQNVDWGDFAILARTNESANFFASALNQTQIPYRFLASRGLYKTPIVLDILAYLRLLDDYHESAAVHRILNSSVVGLSHQDIVRFNYWAKRKGYSLFTTLQRPDILQQCRPEVRQKIDKFLNLVDRHSRLAREKSTSEVVVKFIEDSGYLDDIKKSNDLEVLEATNYLDQFYKKILSFEQSTENNLVKHFLELVDLELEAGETGVLTQDIDEGPDAVKVMTVHGAKGLEFKYVFIVNLVDRRFPSDDRPDPIALPEALIKEILPEGDAHLQEERRLFYVAMTRAKRGLYFTSAVDYGGARKKKLSRFLAELAEFKFKIKGGMDSKSYKPLATHKLEVRLVDTTITREDWQALLPKKFSFTQLKSFENCPYHYWLEYILKIPQPGKPVFSFGSTIHTTLQRFFLLVIQRSGVVQQDLFGIKSTIAKDKSASVSQAELLEIYQRSWIDDWYQTRQDHDRYFELGQKILKNFHQDYLKESPSPKYLEQPFNLFLDDGADRHILVGKIDRVDSFEDGLELIDYKTGQAKTQKTLSVEDKQQLLIYQLAAGRQFDQSVKKLTYYYLENGSKVSFLGSDKDLEKMQQKIVQIINAIYNANFPPKPSDCTCRNGNIRNL